jgi:hypothetical protein
MNRALLAIALFATMAASPALALAQAAQPMPPPPPPPPGDPNAVPIVVKPAPQAQPAAPAYIEPEDKNIRKANNAIFLELGGNGLIYSINYERIFGDSDFGVRVGLSYISLGASSGSSSSKITMMTFPVMANYYGVGSKDHKLQLGAGVTFLSLSGSSSNGDSFVGASGFAPAPTLAIGYRYLPARGGFSFFIGFTPFIIPGGDKVLFPWGGMSFGGIF